MDMRKWFLLEDRSLVAGLLPTLKYVPATEHRSPSVLKLFCAGIHCGFKLTTPDGVPTPALQLMATLMGAQLCQAKDLPEHEKKAFGKEDWRLINALGDSWYLREISDRARQVQMATALPAGREQWHFSFLPELDAVYINYKDPDGKRRKRQCWIAGCPPDWEVTQVVYKGLWRWTRENLGPLEKFRGFGSVPWPDAYTLIREDPAIGAATGVGAAGGCSQETCAAAATGLPTCSVGV